MHGRLRAAALAVFTVLGASAQIYGPALREGFTLTDAAVQSNETALQTNPHDFLARARLIGHYSARSIQDPAMRRARLEQIQWLVENQPATMLLRHPTVRLQAPDANLPGGNWGRLETAWQKQVDAHPDDPAVIENAWLTMGNVELNRDSGMKAMAAHLKRLRELEPGDPGWALDLAGLYALRIPRGVAPGASLAARDFAFEIRDELAKSEDVAVVGLTGLLIYQAVYQLSQQQTQQQGLGPFRQLAESWLHRAAALAPRNPAWPRVLSADGPKTPAEFGKAITGSITESDLWPGGKVAGVAVPPGARTADPIRQEDGIYSRAPGGDYVTQLSPGGPLQFEAMPPTAYAAGCNVEFMALVGIDGRVQNLQVTAFDHLNIPFVAAARDALRQKDFPVSSVGGRPVPAIRQISMTCPKKILGPDGVEAAVGGVPGGVAGGAMGGVLGGITILPPPPPPPPPPRPVRPPAPGDTIRVGARELTAQLIQQVKPVYPALARNARIQGTVRLSVLIGKDGKVEEVTSLGGPPLLVPSAINAVKQWVYKPTLINGAPVKVQSEVEVNFSLSQ